LNVSWERPRIVDTIGRARNPLATAIRIAPADTHRERER
jgi:hypothetical protein